MSIFDTKTMTLIKSIDVGAARPDGIIFDDFNQRVYVFSHPTKDATVIDSKVVQFGLRHRYASSVIVLVAPPHSGACQ